MRPRACVRSGGDPQEAFMMTTRRWLATLAVGPILSTLLVASAARADGPAHRRPTVTEDVCKKNGSPHQKRCFAKRVTGFVETDGRITPFAGGSAGAPPSGVITPSDLIAAYQLPTSVAGGLGTGKTVALVEAYHYANAQADMEAYRTAYGLPACPSFKEISSTGGSVSSISSDSGWEGEEMLDIDMVSAICPNCNILLVEAPDDSGNGLFDAANAAAAAGANVVSNSWGGDESQLFESNYDHAGVMYTASAGDDGYGASYPATSAYVLAIGGTSLTKGGGGSRGWSETVWTYQSSQTGGTGSGCSAAVATPSWQTGKIPAGCGFRMESDVSANADPQTGVAEYDSGGGGWQQVGGTSEASPIVASIIALLGLDTLGNSFPYEHTSAWFDVTSGSNDLGDGTCTVPFECNGEVGYGPTGWGTPNGTVLATLANGGSSSGGTSSGGADAGPSSEDAGGATSSGGASSGSGTSSGTTSSGGASSGATSSGSGTSSGSTSSSSGSGGTFGGSSGSGSDEDAGSATTSSGGNGFGGGGGLGLGSGSGSGCSSAPGTSAPLGGTGLSLVGLGAMLLLGARRRGRR
jgi:subtilase family serine protease